MTTPEWFDKARRRGCPLLAIPTPEPVGMTQTLTEYAASNTLALWQWDCASGLVASTQEADDHGTEDRVDSPERMLTWARSMPSNAVLVAQWHSEYWNDALIRQGVMNLRDVFKSTRRTLVLTGRYIKIPSAVHSDFLVYEETLPGAEELSSVIGRVEQATGLTGTPREQAIDALRGMTLFEAEQHAAMAASKDGISIPALWQAKVALVNSTPGLSCWEGRETIAQVKGLDALIQDFEDIRDGRLPVRLVIWVDESEDVLAGVEGDTSGVSQDYLGTLAKHIEDTKAQSILLAGHPGTGKSLSAKAAGSVFECLVLAFDLGGMKGSLVGESESNLRHALAVERAIVGHQKGSTLWIWTTNNAEALPHKLRARMQGEYFCDLPQEQEALSIWSLYKGQYEIDHGEAFPPNCDEWTGREIARCCRLAWQYRRPLIEAGKRIVPIKASQAQAIQERRKKASGRYLDASKGGVYRWSETTTGRNIEV